MQTQHVRSAIDSALIAHEALTDSGIQVHELSSLVALRDAVRKITMPVSPVVTEKFTKLDENWKALPADAKDFAAVAINPLRIAVAKIVLPRTNQESIIEKAAALDYMGVRTWQAIGRLEALNGIWDPARAYVAYDPQFWGWIPTDDWVWTRDAFAAESYAWDVHFGNGYSLARGRGSYGYGLAVAPLPPGQ